MKIATACLSAALLTAALTAPASAAEGERCLMSSQVNGFSKATRDSVVLSVGARDYLVEFAGACIGIEDAITVAAVSATSCFTPGDKIVFKGIGERTETCFVRKVTFIPKDDKTKPKAD